MAVDLHDAIDTLVRLLGKAEIALDIWLADHRPASIEFYSWTRKETIMALTITDTQTDTLTIQPQERRGNPASLDGAPTWTSSDPAMLSVTPSADGMSAEVSAVGPLGTATVTVTADADLTEGRAELTGTLDVTIVAGTASQITMTPGTPTEQPVTP